MWELLENFGWIFVFNGLFAVFLIAVLALVRSDDASWQAFAWLYGIAWAWVYVGFRILRRVGAWPPSS